MTERIKKNLGGEIDDATRASILQELREDYPPNLVNAVRAIEQAKAEAHKRVFGKMPADYDEDVEVLLEVRKIMADEIDSRTIDPTARDPKDPRLLAPLRHPVSDAEEKAKKIEKDQEAYINNKVREYQAMGMDPRYKTRAKDRLAKVEIGDRNEDTRSLKDKLKGDYKNAKEAEKKAAEKAEKDRIEEAKHNAAAARAKVDADKAAKAAAKAATKAAEAQAKAAAAQAKATEANNKATAMKMQRSNERE